MRTVSHGPVEITKPRFAFRKESFLVKPTISFSIANKGTIPIKTIYMHGKVQTPGRAVPWVEHDLDYAFPGGLEPGEAKDMNLEPNMFSEWKNVPQDAVKGAVLSLTLLAVEDAAGKHIGQDVAHDDDVSQRQKALEDEIAALKKKINDLERELKPGG